MNGKNELAGGIVRHQWVVLTSEEGYMDII